MSGILEVSNLTVRYPGVRALDDVSFEVEDGGFHGIIGPNGAGKSTLFSCMLGLNPRYTGSVKIFGKDIRRSKEILRHLGYVPQEPVFERNFPATVREVIRFGMWRDRREERINEVMHHLRIYEIADRRVGQLSGGQLRRVFIAKAIVNDPKLLILDEPITGIDQSGIDLFYGILKYLNAEHGITIIWTSHDLAVVKMMADNVTFLDKKLVFHGSAEHFFSNKKLRTRLQKGQALIP